MSDDPWNLERFVSAQEGTYQGALRELTDGAKTTHWMWYIFPQVAGLGRSPMSQRYAVQGIEEARAYLRHPVLGARLVECANALLAVHGLSAYDIMGSPDDMKLRSCATLFDVASPGDVFAKLLERYFEGTPDEATLRILRAA
jgi:uncharacterized protein (DUF1810 family)